MRSAFLLLLAPALALAQSGPDAWLDTPAARAFRDRVVQLAVIYRHSSGIDPEGYRIETRLQGTDAQGCAIVDIRILHDAKLVRRERQTACKR